MLVTLQQAKDLKELGYDVPCENYMLETGIVVDRNTIWTDCIVGSASPLHDVSDWLREKGLHVSVTPTSLWAMWLITIYDKSDSSKEGGFGCFDTYNEALSYAITRALQILKERKPQKQTMSTTAIQQVIDELAKYSWGHYDPMKVVVRFIPIEQEQIEQAHVMGSKCGFIAGSNMGLGIKPETTAQQDASKYYLSTYEESNGK